MSEIIPLEYQDIDGFKIEVSGSPDYLRQGGIGDTVANAQQGIEACIEGVRKIADGFSGAFARAAVEVRPAEIELKVGIKAGGGSNWIIASGSAEANFEIKLVWRPAASASR